jgi:hypothetical protein
LFSLVYFKILIKCLYVAGTREDINLQRGIDRY